ncbi:hypothetical protein D3C78_855430 [compost metagenome]
MPAKWRGTDFRGHGSLLWKMHSHSSICVHCRFCHITAKISEATPRWTICMLQIASSPPPSTGPTR